MVHLLKLSCSVLDDAIQLAQAVVDGRKTYELRVNDRDYRVGDLIIMSVYDLNKTHFVKHHVSNAAYVISYITKDGNTKVILGIKLAVPSNNIIDAIILRYKSIIPCDIYTKDGKVIKNAIITTAYSNSLTCTISYDEKCMVDRDNILWIQNSNYSDYALGVEYNKINLNYELQLQDFYSDLAYSLFEKRCSEYIKG